MKKNMIIAWPMRVLILICVFFIGSVILFFWWQDGMVPVDAKDETSVTFIIEKGETVRSIAAQLAVQRLVRSKTAFFLLVKLKGIDDELQAGNFFVKRSMTAVEVADTLTHGAVDIWVTTLEGWRVEEIATKLSQELKIPEQEFISVSREGYMFPDTYLLPKLASASAIVEIFERNFNKRVTPQMREDAKKIGLSMDEVVILASIVEREGIGDTDRPIIAGILLNRLREKWPLQVDATLQYALGYQVQDKTWWKKVLNAADKDIVSPYNTYTHIGLPPGPIANPGISSIRAVLYPTPSEYWYYLHDAQGVAHYGKTLQEHQENINAYLK